MAASKLHKHLNALLEEVRKHADEYSSGLVRRVHWLAGHLKAKEKVEQPKPVQLELVWSSPVSTQVEAPVEASSQPTEAPAPEPAPAPPPEPAPLKATIPGRPRPFKPHRTAEDDRAAFMALASGNKAQRRLYARISQHGMSATAEALGVQSEVVMEWIRTGDVPDEVWKMRRETRSETAMAEASRAARYAPSVREEALRSTLPARELARKLGCGHQTILRWRREVCDG